MYLYYLVNSWSLLPVILLNVDVPLHSYDLHIAQRSGRTVVELDPRKQRFSCSSGEDGACGEEKLPRNGTFTQQVFITDVNIDTSGIYIFFILHFLGLFTITGITCQCRILLHTFIH